MSRRDFIRLISMGMVALLFPFRIVTGEIIDESNEVKSLPRFDIFPLEDISGEPSYRNARRILKFPVKSVEVVVPENPPWERIVVVARV